MIDPLLRHGSPVQNDTGVSVRFYWSKWVTFSCAAILMVSAGLPYAFSIYGSALQKALYLGNSHLSMLGAFSNAGGYLALFSGMAYDYLKRWKRAGPFLCVLVGCSCYAVGFYGLYVIGISRDASEARFWALCILSFTSSNGGTWLEAAALSTTLRNFETHRGPVVGILKAFLGLSASIYTTLYVTFCKHRLDVLWLLAIVPSSVGAVAGVGVNLVPFRQTERASKEHAFHMAIYATLSMAIYQLVTAMYFSKYSSGHPLKDTPSGVGLLMCCAVLLLMVPIVSLPLVFGGVRAQPIAEEIQSATWVLPGEDVSCQGEAVRQEPHSVRLNLPTPRLPDNASDTDEGFLSTSKIESTLVECLRTLDYWLLCGSISITSGAGLAFINNASSITLSMHGSPSLTSVIVSNFSVFNCIGRMCTTFLPDRVWRKHVARTDFLVLGHLFSAACSVLAAHSTTTSLPLVAVITGGTFGFMQGLAPTIVSELFGLANFASNYALLTTMYIFSSFSIANGLMSWNYDLFSNHHHPPQCHGSQCHRLGFYICAGLCTFACVLSIILTFRRKAFYHMMHKAVRREKRKRGADAIHIHRDKMLNVLLRRVEHAASLSQQRIRETEDRKQRLMSLMSTCQRRLKPEQVQLIQTWQEEFALLEQGLEKVDSVLHGFDAELHEDSVVQSFISEPSSSIFHHQT